MMNKEKNCAGCGNSFDDMFTFIYEINAEILPEKSQKFFVERFKEKKIGVCGNCNACLKKLHEYIENDDTSKIQKILDNKILDYSTHVAIKRYLIQIQDNIK